MKKFRFIAMMFVAIMTCVTFSACSDDDDDNSGNTSEIVGTWYSTDNGKRSVVVTFNEDRTGYLESTWNGLTYHKYIYTFTYTYGGGVVKCDGTMVESSEDGTETSSYSMEFKYSGGQLTGGRWADAQTYRKR